MGVVLNVIWSLLALIIAAVVCYLIYDEYIVENPEESEFEKELEADLISMEAEAGVSGFESLPDSRHAGDAPAIRSDGAAIIGASGRIDDAADGSDDAPVAQESTAEVAVTDTVVGADAVVVEETAEVEAVEESADEAVTEAAATMNTVVVEDAGDVEVVVDEELVTEELVVKEAEAVTERIAEVPLEVDDLTKIKGIGKVYAQRLNEAGIVSYQQIIDADEATLEKLTKAIPAANAFDWSRQARKLSDG